MDATFIVCHSCNARLKVPATLAPGKKVKCPKCGALVTMRASGLASDEGYHVVPSNAAAARVIPVEHDKPSPSPTKPCPYCGELVLASAVKCKHCGEFLDAEVAKTARRNRSAAQSSDELTPAEYLVATLGAPIGLAIGIFWAVRKLAKARQMIQASALSCIIVAVGCSLYWFYFVKETVTGNVITQKMIQDAESEQAAPYGGLSPNPNFPGYGASSGPQEMPPDLADLDQQPEQIRNAMKANVRITQDVGGGMSMGSGVICRRESGKAWILTNRHVVDTLFAVSHGTAQVALSRLPEPEIMYVTGEKRKGKVIWVATDEVDLAEIEAPCPDEVAAVSWHAGDDLQIGEQVFAVGNPAGLGWTLTRGVVSALRQHEYGTRKVPVVQTDTRIGPGNSGGGLYNQKGELIGINTFVVSGARSSAGETGLGFAIRKNVVFDMKPDIVRVPAGAESKNAEP